jgi:hypothetical protein
LGDVDLLLSHAATSAQTTARSMSNSHELQLAIAKLLSVDRGTGELTDEGVAGCLALLDAADQVRGRLCLHAQPAGTHVAAGMLVYDSVVSSKRIMLYAPQQRQHLLCPYAGTSVLAGSGPRQVANASSCVTGVPIFCLKPLHDPLLPPCPLLQIPQGALHDILGAGLKLARMIEGE